MARPFDSVESWLEAMSEQFETATRQMSGDTQPSSSGLDEPRIDFVEFDHEYRIVADVPGYESADIDVVVTDHTLTIEAEGTAESTVADGEFIRQERSRSTMHRRLDLPADVDTADISATLDSGTLEIRVPRTEPLESGHSIDIE